MNTLEHKQMLERELAVSNSVKLIIEDARKTNDTHHETDKTGGLGEAIKWIRVQRNMTQSQLADAASLERTSITNIEKGNQTLTTKNLPRIARALNCTLSIRLIMHA